MEEKKICNNCKEEKSISDFFKKYKTKDGIQKYQAICKNVLMKRMLKEDLLMNIKKKKENMIYHIIMIIKKKF